MNKPIRRYGYIYVVRNNEVIYTADARDDYYAARADAARFIASLSDKNGVKMIDSENLVEIAY